jgi:hypothetical protein
MWPLGVHVCDSVQCTVTFLFYTMYIVFPASVLLFLQEVIRDYQKSVLQVSDGAYDERYCILTIP